MTAVHPWNAYWESLPPGHLFFPQEGEEAVRNLGRAITLTPDTVALDYGCGYGQAAAPLAPLVGRLYVWDHAEPMRRFAAEHLKRFPNVFAWEPGDTAVSFDLIWVNSVVQYMTTAEFADVLTRCGRLLNPGGKLVVSDLIPPGLPFHSDVLSLLRFSLRRGYMVRAFRRSLALRKQYTELSEKTPLYHPTRDEVRSLAAAAGLTAEYLPKNLTHFRGRETVVMTRATV